MSKNFFAALDDSGDEAEVAKVKVTTKKETKKPAPKPAAVEPAKSERRRPNNNDRNTKQGRGRGPARDGKRTYDRRSGTGRGKEIKKGGGGARNWGNDKNEARKAEGTVIEDAVDTKPEETTTTTTTPVVENPTGDETAEAPETTTTTTTTTDEPEVEEEDKTMTYEDYLKSKQAPDTEAFKPVAERQLVNEFEGKAVQKAVEEDFLVMGGGKAIRKKGTKKGDKKSAVDVRFRVSSGDEPRRNNDRRGNDRRGRGGGGGGGRGASGARTGGRGGKGGRQGGAINVTDVNAFPSL